MKNAASFCDHLPQFTELCQRRTVGEWAAQADVSLAEVEHLAESFSTAAPASILVGWGWAGAENGVAIVRALDAPGAVTGNLGVPGAACRSISSDAARLIPRSVAAAQQRGQSASPVRAGDPAGQRSADSRGVDHGRQSRGDAA